MTKTKSQRFKEQSCDEKKLKGEGVNVLDIRE
jgi:hypothetical protein